MKNIKWLMLSFALTMLSCSPDVGFSENERTEAAFLDMLNGNVSPTQWWKTSVTLNVNVRTKAPAQIWVMSELYGGTLYDYREVTESGTVRLSAPQGKGLNVYLISVCGRNKSSQLITLSGKNEEYIDLDLTSGKVSPSKVKSYTSMFADICATDNSDDNEPDPVAKSLWGNSVGRNGFLLELNKEQTVDYYTMMNLLSREGQNAKTAMGLNVDYELGSQGPFNITWIAGNCQSGTPHVLGYYYHSPGTYDDIKYVDLCETEIYDVIDGYAKVQYQVNKNAVNKYPEDNLQTGKWYAANFDLGDKWGRENPCVLSRKGDNAWNSMAVFERYGRDICRLRGLTFEVNVPEGMRLGFYDRAESEPSPEQYDRLVRRKIKPYTDREHFKGTNFSAEGMNVYNEDGEFRSFIQPLSNIMWMGMENQSGGGDLDCNDVIFGVSAKMDIFLPSVEEPDLRPTGEYDDLLPWTIAYEDVGREADFDFNDAVIKVVPDFENELCCVTVEAVGSTSRMYLHYDGPDGDVNMGEMHELMNGNAGTKINTTSSIAQTPFVEVDCVPWPKDYTMSNDAKRFWIEIQRGTCTDCTDMITLAETPGQVPQALLVAGDWKWPVEGVHIFSAYNSFTNWAKDSSKTGFWNWYSTPKAGTVVNR